MSKTNDFETAWLAYIFNGTNLAKIGDAGGLRDAAGGSGSLYIGLYTISPGEGTPGTECNYTDYARVAVARSGAGWTVAGSNASNAGIISFPTAGVTATDLAVTVGIHGQAAGATLLYYGALDISISISTPSFIPFPLINPLSNVITKLFPDFQTFLIYFI